VIPQNLVEGRGGYEGSVTDGARIVSYQKVQNLKGRVITSYHKLDSEESLGSTGS